MDIANLKSASSALDEPVWVNGDVHGISTVRLLVVPRGAKETQLEVNRILRGLGPEHRDESGDITEEAVEAVEEMTLLAALKGWDGFTDGKKKVPYSPQKAEELCQSSVFWSALRTSVAHVTQKAAEAIEALEKN